MLALQQTTPTSAEKPIHTEQYMLLHHCQDFAPYVIVDAINARHPLVVAVSLLDSLQLNSTYLYMQTGVLTSDKTHNPKANFISLHLNSPVPLQVFRGSFNSPAWWQSNKNANSHFLKSGNKWYTQRYFTLKSIFMLLLTWKTQPFATNRSPVRLVGTFLPVSFRLEGFEEVFLNGGGGVTLWRRRKPLQKKQKRKGGRWGREGSGVVVMVYDLQGETKMFCFFCVFQISESPVPSCAMLMTSLSMKLCLCPLSRFLCCHCGGGQSTKSTSKLCSVPRTMAGCGGEACPDFGLGGEGKGEEGEGGPREQLTGCC